MLSFKFLSQSAVFVFLANVQMHVHALVEEPTLANTSEASPSFTVAPFESQIANQRYHYELAKSSLKKKDTPSFRRHYAMLGDYPLVPYLDYTLLKQNLAELPFDQIDTFLAANKGAFLALRAREQVLYELAKQKQWPSYIDYFNDDIKRVDLRCYHLMAKLKAGDHSAIPQIGEIWNSAKSLPKPCDPLFKDWKKAGGLTQELAWSRFNKAMEAKRTSLGRYISRSMTGETKTYAEKFLKIHHNPWLISKQSLFTEHNSFNQDIIAYGVRRLSQQDPLLAIKHWERYEAQQLFDEKLARDTKLYVTKRLAYRGHLQAAERVVQQSTELQQTEMIERLIRESLKNLEWAKAVRWMDSLSDEKKASNRWMYWRARARDELAGHATSASQNTYAKLAKTRSFYGFLSADILETHYALIDSNLTIDPSTLSFVKDLAAVKRAKELWLRANDSEAQAEWMFATKTMSREELLAAGTLAADWGWYNKGINAMISGNHWDQLELRFPLAYQSEIQKVSRQTNVEVPLLYAITRQESAFKEAAESHVGARGLMQLMPSTAKQTARKNGVKLNQQDLFKPEINLALGGMYLNELLEKFSGNRILAAAAYNAGPHRVKNWTNRDAQVPYDVWIEVIPFKETRGYVQNVLAYSVIYSDKLGLPKSFIRANESDRKL